MPIIPSICPQTLHYCCEILLGGLHIPNSSSKQFTKTFVFRGGGGDRVSCVQCVPCVQCVHFIVLRRSQKIRGCRGLLERVVRKTTDFFQGVYIVQSDNVTSAKREKSCGCVVSREHFTDSSDVIDRMNNS